MAASKRIVVGITGASGAVYAKRLIQCLVSADVQTHLVVSPVGQRILHDELGMEGVNLATLSGLPNPEPHQLKLHPYRDTGAVIASGSFAHDGMVIVPCTSNTLSAVANGSSQNLLHRAAAVTLKERRRLVLVHREMPLSHADTRNIQLATEAGAIVCPANPGFYMLPKTIDDLVDFVVARILDLIAVEHSMPVRWGQHQPEYPAAPEPSTPC